MSKTIPQWKPIADEPGNQVDDLVTEDGEIIARVEDFGNAAYPCAINAATGNLERGGPHPDRAAAFAWCERVAGLHPTKSGDERPAFYYSADAKP